MARTKGKHDNWNTPIMIIGFGIYVGLLILFGWQTWQFVNFLFPNDQLLMKVLTFISFDCMALVWAVVHTFYKFASRGAKKWVVVAWVLTFILSLVASILYLVIQSFFRFQIAISTDMVNTGYAISLIALVFNVLSLMFWLMLEYRVRHPRQDEFDLFEDEIDDVPTVYEQPVRQRPADTVESVRDSLQESQRTTAGMQIQFMDYMRKTGMSEDETEKAMAEFFDGVRQHRAHAKRTPTGPLAQPQLDTKQASQSGQTNGNGSH